MLSNNVDDSRRFNSHFGRLQRQQSKANVGNYSDRTSSYTSDFDQNHPQFLTCCRCHVRSSAFFIGFLELIALTAAVAGTVIVYLTWNHPVQNMLTRPEFSLGGACVAFAIGCLVVALLLYGLASERPAYLVPHMIAQLVAIIGLMAAIVVFVYIAFVTADERLAHRLNRKEFERTEKVNLQAGQVPVTKALIYTLIVAGLCSLACVFEIYFLTVVYRAYEYLYAKKEAAHKASQQLPMVVTSNVTFRGDETATVERCRWPPANM